MVRLRDLKFDQKLMESQLNFDTNIFYSLQEQKCDDRKLETEDVASYVCFKISLSYF